MSSGTQSIRFRRPTNVEEEKPKPKKKIENNALLQEQVRKTHRPWTPSFSLAVRILFLVRVAGAMYSNIGDCDEVFNFWEPLHFLGHRYGFQTWELSPAFALRSWAYIALNYLPARIGQFVSSDDKRTSFFAVRICLGMTSALVEAALYRSVVDNISMRVGRYLFFMLVFSAGMWNSASAFLPSSFAMYTTTLACAYAMKPATIADNRRTLLATLLFATGAIVGWPFALALSIPFVFEELFIRSGDNVTSTEKSSWTVQRWKRLLTSGLAAALLFVPVIGVDSLAYGKIEIVPWNIVQYNIFGGRERGPNLYGTEPWTYYLQNLALNFNILVPLAMLSLPALAISNIVDRRRLGAVVGANNSTPFTVLALRLAPFYVWLSILTLQPHKEERFMFPAYPLLCFNAAMTTYLVRGWLEASFIKFTKSPYQASQTSIFRHFTFSIIVTTVALSLSRTVANYKYYHAPMTVVFNFQMEELPRLLNDTGLLPVYPDSMPEDERPRIDLAPIREFNLTLCYGKEWHRFPGHFLVPNGIEVGFIKSEFDGILPGHFVTNPPNAESLKSNYWPWTPTRFTPPDFNDLNREEPSHYVPIERCDYLVDLDFPKHPTSSALEPRYIQDTENWERIHCTPFLDARHSKLLTRVLWFPGDAWSKNNEFGDYCVLKNKASMSEKETRVSRKFKGRV